MSIGFDDILKVKMRDLLWGENKNEQSMMTLNLYAIYWVKSGGGGGWWGVQFWT